MLLKSADIELLLTDVYDMHGYDFTNYSPASLRRRVSRLYELDKFPSFAEFRHRVRSDNAYIRRFVEEITVNVTEMFRDPSFYLALREHVLPAIGSKPFIRIWHAGCATGEEVYSMAILLKEQNLLHKSLIYATDLNPDVLEVARTGMYALQHMKQYSRNYILGGGRLDFSSYYTTAYGKAKFSAELSKKMIFSAHNLVSDRSFNSFDLILCRNVLIYFDRPLQDRVFELFDESLENLGFIGLGSKETLRYNPLHEKYRQVNKEKIWRKTI